MLKTSYQFSRARPIRANLALSINCEKLFTEELDHVLAKIHSPINRGFIKGLCEDACVLLMYCCVYVMVENTHATSDEAIQQAVYEVINDFSAGIDDLQVCDLGGGVYLQYLRDSNQVFTDDSFIAEFINAEHARCVESFVKATVKRIYHEIILPVFYNEERKIVEIREEYGSRPYTYSLIVVA